MGLLLYNLLYHRGRLAIPKPISPQNQLQYHFQSKILIWLNFYGNVFTKNYHKLYLLYEYWNGEQSTENNRQLCSSLLLLFSFFFENNNFENIFITFHLKCRLDRDSNWGFLHLGQKRKMGWRSGL